MLRGVIKNIIINSPTAWVFKDPTLIFSHSVIILFQSFRRRIRPKKISTHLSLSVEMMIWPSAKVYGYYFVLEFKILPIFLFSRNVMALFLILA